MIAVALVAVGVFVALGVVPLPGREVLAVPLSDHRRVDAVWPGSALVGALFGWAIAGPGGAVVGAGLSPATLWVARRVVRPNETAQVRAALPAFVSEVGRNLRSGHPLANAVVNAAPPDGPLAVDLDRVRGQLSAGARLGDSLIDWVERRDLPEVRMAAAIISLGAEHGLEVAPAMLAAAERMEQSALLAAEVRALSSQATASAWMIGLAPLAFLVLASFLGSSPVGFFATPVGALLLAVGLALDGLGVWWMRRVITAAQP